MNTKDTSKIERLNETNSEVVNTRKENDNKKEVICCPSTSALKNNKQKSSKIKKAKSNVNISISKPEENGDISISAHVDFDGIIKGIGDIVKTIIN